MPAASTSRQADPDLEAALSVVLSYMSRDALRRLDRDVELELAADASGSGPQAADAAISQAVRALATSRERAVRRPIA